MSETFLFEGIEFDLTISYADTIGVEWEWAGAWTAAGEPLMRTHGVTMLVSLPDVYKQHGPLIPIHPRPSAAQYKAAIDVDPDYAATVAAGYVEAPAAFGERIAITPAPAVPQLTAHHLPPSPLEQTGFRGFLKSLRGGQ
ncbi:phiSA1p31-related protein [[Kitasatospora] papulosa]|uniref:phiSA1p31-related protein n=1 Tax=[Kitasatospora] papulosa TaxID=1464011 RepID=UPI0037D959CF